MKLSKSIMPFLLLLIVVPGFSVEDKKDCRDVPVVQLHPVSGEYFERSEPFSAELKAETRRLLSGVEGIITSIRVNPGDIVTENWAVAEINNALADEIEAAQANVKKWERILWKREHWAERSERAEKQARDNIARYKEELQILQEKSADYILRTDLSGAVESILVSEGDSVSPGTPIATIKNTRRLLFSISLPPKDQEYIQTGQTIRVFLKNDAESTLDAVVTRIDKDKVHFYISNESEEIPADSEIRLKIRTRKMENAIFVPSHLVLSNMEAHYVFVPEYYEESVQARRQPVVIGETRGEEYWVKSGLESGDTVIRTGLRCLENGKTISLLVKDAETGKLKLIRNGKQMEKISLRRIPSEPVMKTEEKVKKPAEKKEIKIEKKPKKEIPGKTPRNSGRGIGTPY